METGLFFRNLPVKNQISKLFLSLIFIALLMFPAVEASAVWNSYTVDTISDTGQFTSIATDSLNKIHISYLNNSTNNLMYATNASGSWTTEILDYIGIYYSGAYTSIALDSSDKVHISYTDYSSRDLKYANNVSGSWMNYTIDSPGNVGGFSSIAIDSLDKIHISYTDASNNNLKYATNISGSWVNYTIDTAVIYGTTSIAIDSLDNVYISYRSSRPRVRYATNVSGSWVTQSLGYGTYSSIAIDSSNNVHISYYDTNNDDLKYVTNASGSWVFNTLDISLQPYGGHISIAIDSLDKVHISYCVDCYKYGLSYYGSGIVKYATNSSGTWVNELVDNNGKPGWYTSIAIDSADNIYISYYEANNNDLKFSTNFPATDDDGDGYNELQGDCDDGDPSINPGAVEIWYDGTDQNCDGWNDYDQDMDGYVDSTWNAEAGGRLRELTTVMMGMQS